MATLNSPLGSLSGKLDSTLHARKVNGKNIIAQNPRFSKETWRKADKYARSRENTYNFTAQSQIASGIYSRLNQFRKLAGPYAHNAILAHLAPLFRKGLFGDRQAKHIDADIIARHLLGFDISPAALRKKGRPESTGFLSLEASQPIDTGSTPHAALLHSYRVHTIQVEVKGLSWDDLSSTYLDNVCPNPLASDVIRTGSLRIPASSPWYLADPAEIDTINAESTTVQAAELSFNDRPILTFTLVEWRESHGNRHRFLRDRTAFRVTGLTLSKHAAIDLILSPPDVSLTETQIESKLKDEHNLLEGSFAPAIPAPARNQVAVQQQDPLPHIQHKAHAEAYLSPATPTQNPLKIRANSTVVPLSGTSTPQHRAARSARA